MGVGLGNKQAKQMKQISFWVIDLVMSVQMIVMILGAVCAIYLLFKIRRNK